MTYNLKNQRYGINEKTECFCATPDDVVTILGENFFWNILLEAYDSLDVIPSGTFIEDDVNHKVYRQAKSFIDDHKQDFQFISKGYSDTGEQINSTSISMAEYIMELLDRDYDDSSWSSRVGGYIESCLVLFNERASWHISLYDGDSESEELLRNSCEGDYSKRQIVLWFGIDHPIFDSPWVITDNTDDLSFWFNDDPWTFLEAISDLNYATLVWYTAECCYWTPDIETIRQKCPIVFSADESGKTVLDRAKCLTNWNTGNAMRS